MKRHPISSSLRATASLWWFDRVRTTTERRLIRPVWPRWACFARPRLRAATICEALPFACSAPTRRSWSAPPKPCPTLARAALTVERGLSVAVIVGDPEDAATQALAARARATLRPEDAVLVVKTESNVKPGESSVEPSRSGVDPHWISGRELVNGQPAAYVCRGVECSLPALSPDELATLC